MIREGQGPAGSLSLSSTDVNESDGLTFLDPLGVEPAFVKLTGFLPLPVVRYPIRSSPSYRIKLVPGDCELPRFMSLLVPVHSLASLKIHQLPSTSP